MISLFSVIFSSFHHEGKVHIAAMQQPPLPVLLSPAGAKQGHPLTLVSCVGSNSGSHQEGIRVPAPFSRSSFLTLGWGVPSICPALPRESSAQVALGPQSPSMPLPRTFHPACFSPCWLPAKLGRCSGGGPQQTGWGQKDVDRGWCRLEWAGVCPGRQEESKGQSKAEGMRLGPCQDMGWERDGHKALGQGRVHRCWARLGAGGTETAHPKAQGRAADPCLCKPIQAERHLCVPMSHSGALIGPGHPHTHPMMMG